MQNLPQSRICERITWGQHPFFAPHFRRILWFIWIKMIFCWCHVNEQTTWVNKFIWTRKRKAAGWKIPRVTVSCLLSIKIPLLFLKTLGQTNILRPRIVPIDPLICDVECWLDRDVTCGHFELFSFNRREKRSHRKWTGSHNYICQVTWESTILILFAPSTTMMLTSWVCSSVLGCFHHTSNGITNLSPTLAWNHAYFVYIRIYHSLFNYSAAMFG